MLQKLIEGRINQVEGTFAVTKCAQRTFGKGQWTELREQLGAWKVSRLHKTISIHILIALVQNIQHHVAVMVYTAVVCCRSLLSMLKLPVWPVWHTVCSGQCSGAQNNSTAAGSLSQCKRNEKQAASGGIVVLEQLYATASLYGPGTPCTAASCPKDAGQH